MKKNILKYFVVALNLLLSAAIPAMAQSTEETDETLKQKKSATYDYETHIGEITLTSFVPGEMKEVQEGKAIDAIIVMDFSSSMLDPYTSSNTFTRTTIDKIYDANNTYYKNGTKYNTLASISNNAGSSSSKTVDTQIFSNDSGTPMTVNYKGTSYNLNAYFVHDKDNTSAGPSCWLYINVSGKRVFVMPDNSFIEENGTTTIGYWKFPTGTDGYFITPARGVDRPLYIVMKEETGVKISKRIDALQSAVGKFLDVIAEHARKTGKTDRVSTVLFQATGKQYYPKLYGENNGENPTDYVTSGKRTYLMECPTSKKRSGTNLVEDDKIANRTLIGKRFIDMSTQDASKLLKFSISNTEAKGNTPINLGVDLSQRLMEKDGRKDDKVARYVIVFTDGEPSTLDGSGDAYSLVATPAVASAYKLKQNQSTKVYTIYCHSSAPKDKVATFLDHLSSNYPKATTYNDKTTKEETKYYKTATDNLEDIFDEITQEIIVETNEKYDVNTTMKDFVNNNYFQYPDNADEGDIKVYTQNCTSYSKGTGGAPDLYEFNSELVDITSDVNVVLTRADSEDSKDLVEVYGFNYSENWCGMDITSDPAVIHGKQLVIKFPFIFKGGQEVSGALETNTKESGVYPVQKNDDGTPKVDEHGKPIPEEDTDSKFDPPVIYFNTLTITRKNLEPGETAIYEVTRDGSFICRIALGGEDGKETSGVSKTIYGLPGDEGVKFKVSETNWNWAYHEDGSTLPYVEKTVEISEKQPIPLTYEFSGAHLDKTGDHPAERHNHGESFEVNRMKAPAVPVSL